MTLGVRDCNTEVHQSDQEYLMDQKQFAKKWFQSRKRVFSSLIICRSPNLLRNQIFAGHCWSSWGKRNSSDGWLSGLVHRISSSSIMPCFLPSSLPGTAVQLHTESGGAGLTCTLRPSPQHGAAQCVADLGGWAQVWVTNMQQSRAGSRRLIISRGAILNKVVTLNSSSEIHPRTIRIMRDIS